MADANPADDIQAANLKRYWTKGAGATKIQWGTPGDFAAIVSAVADHRRRTTARAQQDRAYAMAVEADRARAG